MDGPFGRLLNWSELVVARDRKPPQVSLDKRGRDWMEAEADEGSIKAGQKGKGCT